MLENDATALDNLTKRFPEFILGIAERSSEMPMVEAGASQELLDSLAREHGPLPPSLADFLASCQAFDAFDGSLKIGVRHFRQAADAVTAGLVCFGELFLEGDGDRVYYDPARRRPDGECSILYLDHDTPALRVMAPDFESWLREAVELLFEE